MLPSSSMIMSITKALQQPKCPAHSVVIVMTKGKTNQMALEPVDRAGKSHYIQYLYIYVYILFIYIYVYV